MDKRFHKIAEIFRSIQGEGRNQGYPCTFIRLAGCNLACSWCDTPQARTGGAEMTSLEIFRRISEFSGRYICITGGEPLLQNDQLLPFLKYLREKDYNIDIETNGTIDFSPLQPHASICMDVKCPSSGEESDISLLNFISERDSVKFVTADIQDCHYAKDIITSNSIKGEIFISPVYGVDYRSIANFILEYNLPVRYQLQLHKVVGVK
jgi:7-carboxy-7-deazaguanine synthase